MYIFLASVKSIVPCHYRFIFSSRQKLVTSFCYQQSVFELRTPFTTVIVSTKEKNQRVRITTSQLIHIVSESSFEVWLIFDNLSNNLLCSYCRPIISPCEIIRTSKIDHGFYREDMPSFHGSLGLIFMIMRYVWYRMEKRADPMSAVRSNNRAFTLDSFLMDCRP